jgi:formate dehydrogenase assembly factor FdhD
MSEFILRGNRIMLDKPVKKEDEKKKVDLILSKGDEKSVEEEMMKQWTHLNVYAIGKDVTDINVGDKVYVRTSALHNAEIVDIDGDMKMLVLIHDVIMIWQ